MTNNFRDFLLFSAGGLLALLSYVVYDNFNSKKKRLSNWKTGENQPIPYKPEWYCFDPKVLQSKNTYKLLISSIIPRPIALVSSMDSNGVLNCAPYSYFNTVGHDPPLIVLGCCINGRTKSKKDTLKNIEETSMKEHYYYHFNFFIKHVFNFLLFLKSNSLSISLVLGI
jgi:hypothetical protein